MDLWHLYVTFVNFSQCFLLLNKTCLIPALNMILHDHSSIQATSWRVPDISHTVIYQKGGRSCKIIGHFWVMALLVLFIHLFIFINFCTLYSQYLECSFFSGYKIDFQKKWLNNQSWGILKEIEIVNLCVDLLTFLQWQELPLPFRADKCRNSIGRWARYHSDWQKHLSSMFSFLRLWCVWKISKAFSLPSLIAAQVQRNIYYKWLNCNKAFPQLVITMQSLSVTLFYQKCPNSWVKVLFNFISRLWLICSVSSIKDK